jgi:hypothetical protein
MCRKATLLDVERDPGSAQFRRIRSYASSAWENPSCVKTTLVPLGTGASCQVTLVPAHCGRACLEIQCIFDPSSSSATSN